MEELPTRPLGEAVPSAAARTGPGVRGAWPPPSPAGEAGHGRDPGDPHHAPDDPGQGRAASTTCWRPGPSLMLAPALRVDRAINRARGEPGRVAVSVLALVRARRAARDGALPAGARRDRPSGARRGPRVRLRAGAALPLLLLPVLPGDAGGAGAGGGLPDAGSAARSGLRATPGSSACLLATLPWLHQKFLPVWLALVGDGALGRAGGREGRGRGWRWAVGLLRPDRGRAST